MYYRVWARMVVTAIIAISGISGVGRPLASSRASTVNRGHASGRSADASLSQSAVQTKRSVHFSLRESMISSNTRCHV